MENLWKTKDGELLNIKDMKTSHIENCLSLLKRNGFISMSTFDFYMFTSGPSGEMAKYYFEQELDHILSSPISKFIDLFEEELKGR